MTDKGATMRLGSYPCMLEEKSFAHEAYGQWEIQERHRHRYEFNNDFKEVLTGKGLRITGTSPTAAWRKSSKSRAIPGTWAASSIPSSSPVPRVPHPLFARFIEAAGKFKSGDGC